MCTDCIIVTYKPDVRDLLCMVKQLHQQVRHIYIVDNSELRASLTNVENLEFVTVIYLDQNLGIAEAQNVGIKQARRNNADFILLSDQDTLYPSGYVDEMLPAFNSYSNVAAIAPSFIDLNQGKKQGFITVHPVWFPRQFPSDGQHLIFQAIASGMIIKASSLDLIGAMDTSLFIDWVDLEWCWRARKLGFEIVGNADVTINHVLGDGAVSIGYREINTRSSIRSYYITRNAFILALHSDSLDLAHRITLLFRSFRYLAGFPLFCKPRLEHLKAVTKGLLHGILNVRGK
jgi:rhamnosyltransferase